VRGLALRQSQTNIANSFHVILLDRRCSSSERRSFRKLSAPAGRFLT
jgi:hypothetical protein